MSTIPASEVAAVNPSVLGVGGSSLDLVNLALTESTAIPIGTVQSFPDATSVQSYFGGNSTEAAFAAVYFQGFDGSSKKPGNLLMAQYNAAAVSGFLRGAALGLTLTQLQALAAGTLTISVGGTPNTSASIDLSGATSFSNAADLIEAGFTAPAFAVTYDSTFDAFVFTTTATGAAATITQVTADALANALKLTTATGAVLSQGADAAVPATFMNAVVNVTAAWATFATLFDPDGSGNAVKQAFAAWKNTQNNRFGYVCWDLDVTPTASVPATGSLGYLLAQNGDSGTCLLDGDAAAGWDSTTAISLAAFAAGFGPSLDFTEKNGRATMAFKAQAGLVATVTTAAAANNLGGNPQSSGRGNGYNFYGAYGSANNNFTWFQRGFCTGDFAWFDSYLNQIWFNNLCQNALLSLQSNAKSIPYTVSGNALIESALADPIAAGLNFGAFAPGPISQSQIAAVNAAAGADVASTLQTQGYYLQVLPAASASRAARTSPPCKLWYLDRGSVQAITLSSIALQ